MKIKAVFFDQDGVIIDTERDGHRVAFNTAFKEFGIPLNWSVEGYHRLLSIGGGKERMRHAFSEEHLFPNLQPSAVDEKIREIHQRKTDIFIEMLISGRLPLRPGVHRMMEQIQQAGLVIGVTTTSSERVAGLIAEKLISNIHFQFILAGDMVKCKKPDPEIYRRAVAEAGIHPEEGLVFEDSHIGVTAARAAGLNIVATVNEYTKNEDLSAADLIFSRLGSSEKPGNLISAGKGPFPSVGTFTGTVNWEDLAYFFEHRADVTEEES